jgi:hypothetical protein
MMLALFTEAAQTADENTLTYMELMKWQTTLRHTSYGKLCKI